VEPEPLDRVADRRDEQVVSDNPAQDLVGIPLAGERSAQVDVEFLENADRGHELGQLGREFLP